MATKDLLKLFKDEDLYSNPVTKEDMDNNLITLADEVDNAKVFAYSDGNITPVDSNIPFRLNKDWIEFDGFSVGTNQVMDFYAFSVDAQNYSITLGPFSVSGNSISHTSFTVNTDNDTMELGNFNVDGSLGKMEIAGFSVDGVNNNISLGEFSVDSNTLSFGSFYVDLNNFGAQEMSFNNKFFVDATNGYLELTDVYYFGVDVNEGWIWLEKSSHYFGIELKEVTTTDSSEVVVASIPIEKQIDLKITAQVSNADNSTRWVFERRVGAFSGESELSYDIENTLVKNNDSLSCNVVIEDTNIVIKVTGVDDTINWYFKLEVGGVYESK